MTRSSHKMTVLTGKAKYKHDLMNCLDPLSQDTSVDNTVITLDTENYISCCEYPIAHAKFMLTV